MSTSRRATTARPDADVARDRQEKGERSLEHPSTDHSRGSSRATRAINRKLKALGAAPVVEPPHGRRRTLSPVASEYQIAMGTYQSEDLSLSISLVGMSLALFALILGTMSGLGYTAGLLVSVFGMAYFLAVGFTVFIGRRATAAAAAVIQFRVRPEPDACATTTPRTPQTPRFALLSVSVGRSSRSH